MGLPGVGILLLGGSGQGYPGLSSSSLQVSLTYHLYQARIIHIYIITLKEYLSISNYFSWTNFSENLLNNLSLKHISRLEIICMHYSINCCVLQTAFSSSILYNKEAKVSRISLGSYCISMAFAEIFPSPSVSISVKICFKYLVYLFLMISIDFWLAWNLEFDSFSCFSIKY